MFEQRKIKNINVIICKNKEEVDRIGADIFTEAINSNPRIVLGLATGGTPVGMYKELIRMNKQAMVDFSQVLSFNLDEYVGLANTHLQSYRYFMNDNFFNHININKNNTYVPDGQSKDIQESCRQYEEKIKTSGGIDLQLLGIGSNGHIAFNEPGSLKDSRTREVSLTEATIKDNARFFQDELDVPRRAVTMGIGIILEAKKIVLLATGANKADAVKKAVIGLQTVEVPASFLQMHSDCVFIIDKQASLGL